MRDSRVTGLVNRQALRRPVILACLLGLASAPPVAWSLLLPPRSEDERLAAGWLPLQPDVTMVVSLVAVLAASLMGGGLAGRMLARHRTSAPLLAIAVAWPTAIAVLPIAASVFGLPLRAAIVCVYSCSAALTSARPISGIDAYLNGTALGAVTPVISLPALGILLVGAWLGRRGRPFLSAVAMVIAYGCLHVWSVLGGAIPFVLLAVGILVWARFATHDELQEPSPVANPGDEGRGATEPGS